MKEYKKHSKVRAEKMKKRKDKERGFNGELDVEKMKERIGWGGRAGDDEKGREQEEKEGAS